MKTELIIPIFITKHKEEYDNEKQIISFKFKFETAFDCGIGEETINIPYSEILPKLLDILKLSISKSELKEKQTNERSFIDERVNLNKITLIK